MIDSHAHVGRCKEPPGDVVLDALQSGVTRILTIGLGEESNREAIGHAEAHDQIFAAVGRHPNSAEGFDDAAAADIAELALHPRVRAVGETGLDFYRDNSPRPDQRRAFSAQIEVARATELPLIIHVRDGAGPGEGPAIAEAFELLAGEADGVTVILHCFSGTPERAREAAGRGWYCSFAGNLTYPSATVLREAAREVPDELLLVETDSPYLAPQPVRGQANSPANVVMTAEVLAAERDLDYAEIEALLEANAARLFGW